MTAERLAQAAEDNALMNRTRYFITKAAIAVVNENPATAKHAERLLLAERILEDGQQMARLFAVPLMTNATLAAASDFSAIVDGDLEFVVNSIYDAMTLIVS